MPATIYRHSILVLLLVMLTALSAPAQQADAENCNLCHSLALLGIAFNGFSFWRNRRSQSLNAKMVNWHLQEDVLGWTVVLAGSIVMHFGDYPWLDPLMALGVTLFILWNVFKSLGRVTKIFLQSNPEGLDLSAIENELRTLNNVEDIHDVHAWSLDGKYHVLSLHVVISQITDQESLVLLKNQIRDQLHKMGIEHSTIEFELPTEGSRFEQRLVSIVKT